MPLNFRKYAESAEVFVKELAVRLGSPEDRDRAARVLRNILHLLRDQITPQESVQLLAQLPMFLKAVYVDGWKFNNKHNKIKDYDEFVSEVRYPKARKIYTDFMSKEEAEAAIYIVFDMIEEKVSPGEINDLVNTLPTQLKPFFERYTVR